MPIYLFTCSNCDRDEELTRKVADRNDAAHCPECSGLLERKLTAPAVSYVDGGHAGEYTKYGPRK